MIFEFWVNDRRTENNLPTLKAHIITLYFLRHQFEHLSDLRRCMCEKWRSINWMHEVINYALYAAILKRNNERSHLAITKNSAKRLRIVVQNHVVNITKHITTGILKEHMYICSFLVWKKTRVWIIASLTLKVTSWGYPIHGIYRPSLSWHFLNMFEDSRTWWLWMRGRGNVSVCRGHELANALYMCY